MAEWTAAYISDLPDSAFACIDAGGEKDDEGKTVPRSLRHYPHHDAQGDVDLPHLRAARKRVAQSDTTSCGAGHLADHAEEMDMGKATVTVPAGTIPSGYTIMGSAHKAVTPFEFKLSETGDVTVAFSRFNVIDADGDVTFPGAFPVGKAVPMSAYGHTSWDGAPPTGKGTISEKADLGVFDGAFFMETDQGRNAYHTTKAMAELQEWSYGYAVLDGGPGTFAGKRVRELRKLDVLEVSPVLKGAGIGTATLAIKSGAPGPDAPFATQLSWYTEGLPALLDRLKSHAAVRATEGRKLSRADRAALDDLIEMLDGLGVEARESRAADDPSPKTVDPVTMDILVSTAQRLGVTV